MEKKFYKIAYLNEFDADEIQIVKKPESYFETDLIPDPIDADLRIPASQIEIGDFVFIDGWWLKIIPAESPNFNCPVSPPADIDEF